MQEGDIPVPERGYWARRTAGKTVIKVKLPPRAPGALDRVSVGAVQERRWTWPPDPVAELAEPEPIEPVFLEPIESVEERVRKLVGKVSAV